MARVDHHRQRCRGTEGGVHHALVSRDDLLAMLRLTVHPEAPVTPVQHGIPWLGLVVYPAYRLVKARNVQHFRRRLQARWQEYCAAPSVLPDVTLACRVGSIMCATLIPGACVGKSWTSPCKGDKKIAAARVARCPWPLTRPQCTAIRKRGRPGPAATRHRCRERRARGRSERTRARGDGRCPTTRRAPRAGPRLH